jgi:hypothetical protein
MEKLHNLYSSTNTIRMIKSRRMRLVGHTTFMGEIRNCKEETLARPRRKAEDNIKRGIKETGSDVGDWIQLAKGSAKCRTLVNTAINFCVPQFAYSYYPFCTDCVTENKTKL